MSTIKFFSIILVLSIFWSCQNNNQKKYDNSTSLNELNEDFNGFKVRFFSDSLFQISRLNFPFESDENVNQISEDDSSIYSKNNWIMLRNNFFKDNDSIVNIEGEIFKRRIKKNENYYEEFVFIEDSGFSVTMKFRIIEKKWFLVDYIECNN